MTTVVACHLCLCLWRVTMAVAVACCYVSDVSLCLCLWRVAMSVSAAAFGSFSSSVSVAKCRGSLGLIIVVVLEQLSVQTGGIAVSRDTPLMMMTS